MLIFLISLAQANCGHLLRFRDALPSDGSFGVSTLTQPFLSFIGDGTVADGDSTISDPQSVAVNMILINDSSQVTNLANDVAVYTEEAAGAMLDTVGML